MCTQEIINDALRNSEPASFLHFLDNKFMKWQGKDTQVQVLISEESKQSLDSGSKLIKQ